MSGGVLECMCVSVRVFPIMIRCVYDGVYVCLLVSSFYTVTILLIDLSLRL